MKKAGYTLIKLLMLVSISGFSFSTQLIYQLKFEEMSGNNDGICQFPSSDIFVESTWYSYSYDQQKGFEPFQSYEIYQLIKSVCSESKIKDRAGSVVSEITIDRIADSYVFSKFQSVSYPSEYLGRVFYRVKEIECSSDQVVDYDNGVCASTDDMCLNHSEQVVIAEKQGNHTFSSTECFRITDELSCIAEAANNQNNGLLTGVFQNLDGSYVSYGGAYVVTSKSCVYNDSDQLENSDDFQNVDNGCIVGETGAMLCLDENGGSTMTAKDENGNEVEASDSSICIEIDGTFQCIEVTLDEPGCGYVNGEYICYSSDGDSIDSDSPDHPSNGGNADGNDNNDYLDPDNSTDELTSSEETAILANKIGQSVADALKDELTEEIDIEQDAFGDTNENMQTVTDSVDQLQSNYDTIESTIESSKNGDGYFSESSALNTIKNSLTGSSANLFDSSCKDFDVSFGDDFTYHLDCSDMSIVRDILKYFFYLSFLVFSFITINQTIKEISE